MKLFDLYYKAKYVHNLRKGIRRRNEQLKSDLSLSKEQVAEINDFFTKTIGKKISLDWHKYFYRRTGNYSPLYIPTDLYYSSLMPKFNHYPFNEAYSDKNITDLLLPDIHQPETLLKNTRGYFYINNEPATLEEAADFCRNLSDVIIKPTFTAHGEGVKKFSVSDGMTTIGNLTIEQLFKKYDRNFLIQKVIRQHPQMAALNESSVNTIRILTFRSGMEILILYTVIRIGRKGFDVDNETAGGISTRINPDGTLCRYAFGAAGDDNIEYTDNGTRLEGYQIPSFDKAIEMVRKAHYHLPHFDLIGWDVAIEEDGEPILIEWNTWPELSQSANGPAFGEHTERILRETWHRYNTRNANWK